MKLQTLFASLASAVVAAHDVEPARGEGAANPQWRRSTETLRKLLDDGFEVKTVVFSDNGTFAAGRRIILQKGPRLFWCADPLTNDVTPVCNELK